MQQVQAAVPRPATGSAVDPIELRPVEKVVITTLVDNVFDALLGGDADTANPSRRIRADTLFDAQSASVPPR